MEALKSTHNIARVSRLSGIPKDLLRQWERRYGYPNPLRDEHGDRIYSAQHLDKLIVIRQLLDQGLRPGKLVKMEVDDLRELVQIPEAPFGKEELIELLKTSDANAVVAWLDQQVQQHGLRAFVHNVMAPATKYVGEAWAEGKVDIHEEHLMTEALIRMVRRQLAGLTEVPQGPRIMLTTVPGEQHSLGMLMVETLMRLAGAEVISFGTEMPFLEIRKASMHHKVDVIALSFSASFNSEDALVIVSGLRQLIPADIPIWTGGEAFVSQSEMPDGISNFSDLYEIERALGEWQ